MIVNDVSMTATEKEKQLMIFVTQR